MGEVTEVELDARVWLDVCAVIIKEASGSRATGMNRARESGRGEA